MENKILNYLNLPRIFLCLLFIASACRNGEFDSENLFEITETPRAHFSESQVSSCDEDSPYCKKFSLHLKIEESNGNSIKLIPELIVWEHAQLKNISIENKNATDFVISGNLEIDPENPTLLLS